MKLTGIETERLRMKPVRRDGLDDLHALWVSPGVRRYLWDDEIIPREQALSAIEESLSLFEQEGWGLWALERKGESGLAGFCGYWLFHDPPQMELLYGAASQLWGTGLAAEAARAMIRYGFEELAFDRIDASADAPNSASVRVMEKAGMFFDRREITNGADTIYYRILRDDFRSRDEHYRLYQPALG